MTQRDRNVVLVLALVGLLVAAYLLVIGPKHDEVGKADSAIAAAKLRLSTAQASETQALAARDKYASDYATVARLGKAVPVDDDVPSLLVQLQQAADQSHVDFRTIALNPAAAGAAPAVATPAAQVAALAAAQKGTTGATGASAAPAGATGATGATGAAGAAQAAAAATEAEAAALPPGASIGPAGFPVMPFTFTFDGSFFHLDDFLRSVGRFTQMHGSTINVHGRLMTINAIALAAGPKGFPQMRISINATAFLLPADEGLTAGATPNGPAATAAAGTAPVSATTGTAAPAPTAVVSGTP